MESKIKQHEMHALLTTKEVANYFKVNNNVVTQKFCKQGLKYIKLSQTDFRYNFNDVIEFEESLKEVNNVENFICMINKNYTSFKRCDKKI